MNIVCPHCNTEINFRHPAIYNVEVYGGRPIAKLPCCGKAIMLGIIKQIVFEPYHGDATHDDWDNELAK